MTLNSLTRVGNFAQATLTQSYILETQSRVNDTNIQIASGKVAQYYDKLSVESARLVDLEREMKRTERYVANVEQAIGRLDIMESSVATLTERTNYLLTQLASALNGNNAEDIALDALGDGFLQEAASLLNVQHEGRYLFSGSRGNQEPVNVAAWDYTDAANVNHPILAGGWDPTVPASVVDPGGAYADYYRGDGLEQTVRADDTFEVTYGMAASRPGFEKLMRALSITEWAGQDGIDVGARDAALQIAYRTARSALEDLSDLRSEIGAEMSVLESTRDSHDDYIAYAQNAVSVIEDVDVAEAVSRLERDQVALQGSYLALSRITSLNLIDFIR